MKPTPAQLQAQYREQQKAKGLKLLQGLWVPEEVYDLAKKMVKDLVEHHQKLRDQG
jgi:ABC-type proline/glycine betaine transport system substrate-binding protein